MRRAIHAALVRLLTDEDYMDRLIPWVVTASCVLAVLAIWAGAIASILALVMRLSCPS